MNEFKTGAIVVALDWSTAGQTALCWAVEEAARVHRRVLVVHVLDAVGEASGGEPDRADPLYEAFRLAHECFSEHQEGHRPIGLAVQTRTGSLLDELHQIAAGAAMVVLGRSQDPAHASLAEDLASKVSCPVVVVRPDRTAFPVQPRAPAPCQPETRVNAVGTV